MSKTWAYHRRLGKMGDIRAGLEDLKLDGALFANVKYYVSGEGDPKVRCKFPLVSRGIFRLGAAMDRTVVRFAVIRAILPESYDALFLWNWWIWIVSLKVIIWNTISHKCRLVGGLLLFSVTIIFLSIWNDNVELFQIYMPNGRECCCLLIRQCFYRFWICCKKVGLRGLIILVISLRIW